MKIRKTKKQLKHHNVIRMIHSDDILVNTFIQQNQIVKFNKFGVAVCDNTGNAYEYMPYRRIRRVTSMTSMPK